MSAKNLTLDHVVPASHNGKKSWDNVVAACRECNQKKANRTPVQARMPLLTKPEAPRWQPVLQFEIRTERVPNIWHQYLRYHAG